MQSNKEASQRPRQHVTAILLAGGTGSRMGGNIAKQYLHLEGRPIIDYSYRTLLESKWIDSLVIVCAEAFEHLFTQPTMKPVCFSTPGATRQESVAHGFAKISQTESLVCVHDGARPFLNQMHLQTVVEAAAVYGAAVLGLPLKPTIKQCSPHGFIERTLDRSSLWEVQTPQVLRYDLMEYGLAKARQKRISVTDDVQLVELSGHPVKMLTGHEQLMKITTPFDLQLAKSWLKDYNEGSPKKDPSYV